MKDIFGKEMKNDIEYIINCDSKGNIIGPIEKQEAHSKENRSKLTHYSTWAMIYNPLLKKYGLQLKRPKTYDKNSTPMWDMGVAGHNCYLKINGGYKPLSFEDNLIKETDEEIGLNVKIFYTLKEFLEGSRMLKGTIGYIIERSLHKNEATNEWVGFGIILTTETKLEFKDKEVLEFRWLTPEELKHYIEKENNYYGALPIIFKKAEKFRLKHLR